MISFLAVQYSHSTSNLNTLNNQNLKLLLPFFQIIQVELLQPGTISVQGSKSCTEGILKSSFFPLSVSAVIFFSKFPISDVTLVCFMTSMQSKATSQSPWPQLHGKRRNGTDTWFPPPPPPQIWPLAKCSSFFASLLGEFCTIIHEGEGRVKSQSYWDYFIKPRFYAFFLYIKLGGCGGGVGRETQSLACTNIANEYLKWILWHHFA